MDGETIDLLAKANGIFDAVCAITKEAMEGKIDFFESLIKRVALLKGLEQAKVEKICRELPLMNGAKEVVSGLKQMDYKVVCFSGGFRNATKMFAETLGLDGEFANILHSKDWLLTGQVGGEMMFNDSKGQMLQRLQKLLNVSKENTIAVGDGANDLSMFEYSGKRVGFCAKPIVNENADIIIKDKDLSLILDYIE